MTFFKKSSTKKEEYSSYDNDEGRGIYDGVDIGAIICKYVMATEGCASVECNDFPHKCINCLNNKYNPNNTYVFSTEIHEQKSYFKEK